MKDEKVYLLLTHSAEEYAGEDFCNAFKDYKGAKKTFDRAVDLMLEDYRKIGIQLSSDTGGKTGWIVERSERAFAIYESGRRAESECTLKIIEQTII